MNGQFVVEDGTIKHSYVWLHLEGYSAEQSDGTKIAYVCLTDISQEKNAVEEANRIRKVEEEQYTHTIDGILSALPKTISTVHLDLTQNYYSNYHNSVIEEETPLEYGSVDYLIHFISTKILNEKTKLEFNSKFNRLALLKSYQIGQNFLSLDYQHKYSEKSILWETISISIARNPKNEDLEAVLYTVNSEERITLEKINKHIALEEYDNIGTISTLDGAIKFYSRNNFDLTPHAFEKYDDDMRNALPKILPHSELRDAIRELTLKNIQEILSTKDCFIYGFTVITKDGQNLRKQLRYSYLDETKLKILFTRTDITDTTKAEAEQKTKLEKALADAEKANEMKSVFLSSMSHDIRTPLNGIMGYTDLALQENNLDSIKTYLSKIQTSSNSLLLLINDTLDLTRIENGNEILNPEVINTQKYFDDIITTVRPSMEAKKINFIAKIDNTKNLSLRFDRLRMEKIILNLL